MYVLFSSDSDLDLLGGLISRAGFVARLVAERTILIESIILFELTLRCWTFHSHCTRVRTHKIAIGDNDLIYVRLELLCGLHLCEVREVPRT